MNQRRIVINLVFFASLGVLLAVWAVSSIISVDALDRPVRVTAEFDSPPSLGPGLEVTHLGVRVGKIGSVRLLPGRVDVRIDLDRDARVPVGVGARVLRKSAIGEPYVELTPPPASAATPRPMRAGDRIPVARTAGSPDYQQLFTRLGDTLKAVDPRDAQTLVHELATGLEGRETSIHDLIADTHQLTGTLAADAETLDRLSTEVTRLTGTLAGQRHHLASGLNDLATVTGAVQQTRKDLDTVLEDGPQFLARLNELIETSRPGLDCLLTAVAAPSPSVFSEANRQRIHKVLTMVPTINALVGDITVVENGRRYARVMPVISIAGPEQAAEFAEPRAKPAARPLNICPATPGKSTTKTKERGSRGGTSANQASRTQDPATTDLRRTGADGTEPSSGWGRTLPLLPPAFGALVVIAVAAHTARTIRRRR